MDTLNIQPLSRHDLAQILLNSRVIEQDKNGPKVAILTDGHFLKYFHRKRLLNRELIAPAAVKFARNAHMLRLLNIPTLTVKSLHRINGEPHTVVLYEPIAGQTLRELLATNLADVDLVYRLGAFLARVQRKGIYFRSIHPGNIIVDGETFGLIDILDMRFHPWSLSRWARRRNWRHLFRNPAEWSQRPDLIQALLRGYADTADLPVRELRFLPQHLQRFFPTESL